MRLVWDRANEAHIWLRHGVEPFEVEEAFAEPAMWLARVPDMYDERRWRMLGRTDSGRLLYVVLTRREGGFRCVTARDADDSERQLYQRWRRRRGKG